MITMLGRSGWEKLLAITVNVRSTVEERNTRTSEYTSVGIEKKTKMNANSIEIYTYIPR
jgi:hypothetical protein